VHLVTLGQFWSRDKDGGRIIRSTVVKNPMLHVNPMALSFIEPELTYGGSRFSESRNFRPFLLPWPWPWP